MKNINEQATINDPNTRLIVLTPETAERLLLKNHSNRPYNAATAEFYASQMLEGAWPLSPQGISIATDGTVLDGQHRLNAVIISGCSIPMRVVINCEKEVYKVLDCGLRRTTGHRTGLPEPTVYCLSGIHRILKGKSTRIATHDALKYYDVFGDVLNSVPHRVARLYGATPIRVAAIIHISNQPKKKNDIMSIYEDLITRNMDSQKSVVKIAIKMELSNKLNKTDFRSRFAYGWFFLDPKNSNRKTMVGDFQKTEALSKAKDVVERCLNEHK